jgi:GT2 family glycosyltransferase
MSQPSVTAVILNFNLSEYTLACLKSLEEVKYSKLKILVVDNGSTDESVTSIREAFPAVEVHSTGENLGYTGGINAGFVKAMKDEPDYVLVLNPDTEVDPLFLAPLVEAMEQEPKAAAACGTIYMDHDKKRVWYAGGRTIRWRGLAVHDRLDQILEPMRLGEPRTVTFVTGCLVLFRAALLKKVGMEDERFFAYLDDIEFSTRILNRGYSLLYVPKAIVYHKVLGEKKSPLKVYYSVRNRLLLINTSFSGFAKIIARIYFLIAISVKIMFWQIAHRAFARAAIMGLVDYFKGNLGKGRGVESFRYREDM